MAQSIGDLSVNIVARVDRFGANLRVAAQQVGRFQHQVDQAGRGLRGIVPVIDLSNVFTQAAAAAQRLFGFVRQIVREVDDASDRAAKLGTTFNRLAGLEFAGKITGTGPEQISAALTTLTRNLNKVGEGSDRAGLALRLLGLDADRLANIDPADALLEIAEAFGKLDSRSSKAGAALALFGRPGLEILPFLSQGPESLAKLTAEAQRLGATLPANVTDNLTEAADATDRLSTAWSGLMRRIVGSSSLGTHITNMLARDLSDMSRFIDDPKLSSLFRRATPVGELFGRRATPTNAARSAAQAQNFEKQLAVFERMDELRKKAGGIFEQTRSPRERFEQIQALLHELRGTIDDLTGKPLLDAVSFSRAMKAAREELAKAEQRNIDKGLSAASFQQVELNRTDLTGLAGVTASRRQNVHDPQIAGTNQRLDSINKTMKGLALAGVAA